MSWQEDIINNIKAIDDRIAAACKRCDRLPGEVQLLLATKTVPAEKIAFVLRSGKTLIAENKIQELKEKFEPLQEIPHTNHFIGHLQSNKFKDLLRYDVTCVQSIDRYESQIPMGMYAFRMCLT